MAFHDMAGMGMLAMALATAGAAWADDVAIVSQGEGRACVVVPDDAPKCVRVAAAEFAKWTKELTGAELPVGPVPAEGKVPISFALDEAAPVKYDGFRLTVGSSGIAVTAKDPFGIAHSPYWMLNRFGKIWWCDPDSGADFVRTGTFALPAGTYDERPLGCRQGLVPGGGTDADKRRVAIWNIRNGFVPPRVDVGVGAEYGLWPKLGGGGHALGDMVTRDAVDEAELKAEVDRIMAAGENVRDLNPPHDKSPNMVRLLAYYNINVKRHPERFPLIDGKRSPCGVSLRGPYKGKTGNPCLTNPSTREYLLATIRGIKAKAVEADANACFTWNFMCDDTSQHCECDNCMKLMKSKGSSSDDDRASDNWWDFCNWMTARLLEDPKMSVETSIYLTYRQPPTKVKPLLVDAERQSVLICPHGRCYLHALEDKGCRCNAKYRQMFEDWSRFGIPIHTFEYHCQLPGKGNYAFFEKSWIEDLRYYRAHGICHSGGGLFGPWNIYGGWTEQQCPMYKYGAKARWQFINLTGRFSWDADDDFQAARRELLAAYYRAAAPEMLEYRKLLEDAIFRANICMSYGSSGLPFAVASAEPGLMDKALSLLRAAEKKAEGDAEIARRIARDKLDFKLDWESAAGSANVKSAPLHRATGPVAVDGVLNEPTWKKAYVSDDWRWLKTYNVDRAAPDKLEPRTTMLAQCDNENLYLAFVCFKTPGVQEEDLPADGSTFDAMRGAGLEIVVQSPSQNGDYYHLAVSHNGKTYSAWTSTPSVRDLKRTCAFRHAVKDREDRWVVEMSLPLKDFGALPKEGEVWRICAMRTTKGKDGGSVMGSSTGFPLHWMDRWEAFSFGKPGDLVVNGSFEVGAPCPDTPYNGKNWKFRQPEAPAKWNFHQNGGDLDWREGDAAEGRRYIRVTPINACGGPEFIVTPGLAIYLPATTAFDLSFSARGKGYLLFYTFGLDKLEKFRVDIDSAEWKRYAAKMPLTGTHPSSLTVRFMSDGSAPIDFDDLVVLPVR